MADINDKINQVTNTPDHTSEFDPNDIENNKVMAVLAYLSILVIIPLLAAKNSKFARFHCNQGLVLAVAEILIRFVMNLLALIPVVGIVFTIIGYIVNIICLILSIIGIVNAVNGKAKELPVVGSIKFLKY